MSRPTRDGTAEPVSRDKTLRHVLGQRNIHFPCPADHEQDWQPYPVDPYSAIYVMTMGGLGLTSSSSIKGAAYIGCHALVLGRVVAASARWNLPSLLERLPERPMASALIEELKIVATEAMKSQIEDAVGSSWAALAAEEDPQGREIGTLLVKREQEEGGGGGGGRGAGGRGGGVGQREQ